MDERRRGPLRADELAEAAVLADLAVVLIIVGWLMPAGGFLQAAAVTPYAALAVRRRARAVTVGAVAGGSLCFLLGGPGPAAQAVGSALLGYALAVAFRHGWGRVGAVSAAMVFVWLPLVVIADGALAILSGLRHLR